MENKKDITIYDIAKVLELSTSTVSRALKSHKSISDKTTKQVIETAEKMGYRPNTLAINFRSNKTNTIGVLVPTITQPFLSSLISGIEITSKKAGYNVLIMQSHDSYEDEVNLTKVLYDNRVSGIICSIGMTTRDTSHFKPFIDSNIPLVFVDRVPRDFKTYRVVIDNHSAGFKATEHLIEQGCKRIAHFFVGLGFGNLFNERKKGYIDALKKHNLPIDEDLIIHMDKITYEEGEKATNKLLDLKNPPDGIFSPNDTIAVAAIQVSKKRGFKIPEDIAIIGFNDDPISRIIDPGLSTISHPAFEMGKASSKKILKLLKHSEEDSITEITFLNTEVIVRGSSKRK